MRKSYILSDYEQMEQKLNHYMELFRTLKIETDRLFEIAAGLKLPWEGEANKAYIIRTHADSLYMSEILKRLYLAGEHLGMAIYEYQKNEEEVSKLIDALSGGSKNE